MNTRKELFEMTIEELWQLFPICLVAHDDRWAGYYEEMAAHIKGMLSGYPVDRISHIGSTAIQDIWAKDIIDVMIEIPESGSLEKVAHLLELNGFMIMSVQAKRISLNRGYTKKGLADRVYHIHLRYTGDNDELYFRDYLNENMEVAKEYEALKLSLWKKYEHDRDAYTDAKTEFVCKWTKVAKDKYGDRY